MFYDLLFFDFFKAWWKGGSGVSGPQKSDGGVGGVFRVWGFAVYSVRRPPQGIRQGRARGSLLVNILPSEMRLQERGLKCPWESQALGCEES